jgi:hypothetical protein
VLTARLPAVGAAAVSRSSAAIRSAQFKHEGKERLVDARLHDVPDHRQLNRHNQKLPRAVGEGAPVQCGLFDALGDDRERRLDHVAQRLCGRR